MIARANEAAVMAAEAAAEAAAAAILPGAQLLRPFYRDRTGQ